MVKHPPTGCDHRECYDPARHNRLWTIPTLVTLVRTSAGLLLAAFAFVYTSELLLYSSLATYWIGDMLDGALARLLDQETRRGAVLDIVCDRLNCVAFYLVFIQFHSGMLPAVGLVLIEFVIIDTYLSLSFLRWPVHSPNYFYAVDRRIWQLNWSRTAKAINSAGPLLLIIIYRSVVLAVIFILALITVKLVSVIRLQRVLAAQHGELQPSCLINHPLKQVA
jgi:CDP-diacylglycerol--glycerol-3-phosphate 3-phosphatidyltransferase